ncbi:hypothetical protein BT69DRAFT_1290798 [Atractiella rhizophila]|nr:hypothetical protein BT69DRAFT_1290798 [Atractiella rhizophila]
MSFRKELEPGWFEVLSCMGKHERESLMKGYLSDRDEGERMILRKLFKKWNQERYQGS